MRKRFLGFILSVLMASGVVNPAVLNAKTTINPQDFINNDFTRPGDGMDIQPTDENGNPVIKGFDKSMAYMSEVKEKSEADEAGTTTASSATSQESTTDVASSTTDADALTTSSGEASTLAKDSTKPSDSTSSTEVKTVDKKYWKDGKEYTSFSKIDRELSKQLKKKSKDFTINVSLDCKTIKKYRESTFSSGTLSKGTFSSGTLSKGTSDSNSDKSTKSGEESDDADAETDLETDERKDSELIQSMVLESLFNWDENLEDKDQEDLIVSQLETSVGLADDEVNDGLKEMGITALAQETKDDEILEGRYYTTLHYQPTYKGEEKTSTENKKESETTSETKKKKEQASEATTLAKENTESSKASTSAKKNTKKKNSRIAMQAIDNAPTTDVTINFLTAQFISGAKKEKNQLVWTPVNPTSDHMFVFRINYSTSGVGDVPEGGFKITVPKQILRERSGDFADFFTMSLPEKDDTVDDTDEDSEYAWKIEGDNIVIYNCKEITAAQNGYFDIGYSTNKETYYYQDMGESEPFYGTLTIDGKTATTDKIPVVINTQATIDNTSKYYPDIYKDWQSSWGTKPADADDYYYLVWMIGTDINKVTQNYNFTLEDNVSSKDGKVELVGYRMSGASSFSQVNTVSNIHREGIRYDYVLTRHLKSDFDPLESYKIDNNVKATVDPVDQVDPDTDAVANREFKWLKPVFHIPTGRFTIWKYGDENWHQRFGYHRDYSSYELAEFKEGKINSINNLNYFVWTDGFPAPWTLAKGKYSDDPTAYYKNPVTYTVSDDTLYLLDGADKSLNNEVLEDNKGYEDIAPLNKDDYDFSYFTYSMVAEDGSFDDFKKDFKTTTHIANDKDVLTFWIKVDNDDEWLDAGTVNLGTGKVEIKNDHIKSLTTDKVEFNPGVKGWKIATTNAYYRTSFNIYTYVNLFRTENTLAKVKDSETALLKNLDRMVVTYDKDFDGKEDTEIYNSNHLIGDRLRQIEKDSSLEKRAITSSNNVRKKYYDVGWKVEQSEVMTTGKGEKEYIRQNGGTFYDLLPKGSTFKQGSASVVTDSGTLKESQYNYELKADYKNSGRTLLIVRIKPQAKYYNVYYHTQHAWDSIKDYGKDVKNPVAYETGNDSITKGYADDGGKLSGDNKELLTGLDQDSTGKKFLYDEDSHWINALTAAISGLDKKVMTPNDSDWSYETFTVPNGSYQYRWRFANNFTSDSKNMIFFDSLENYVVKSGEKSDWHGTLQRIDTSQMEDKGIAPVVYVSEVENLDLDKHHDLTDSTIWKKVNANTDLSKAKAVSIDIRKKTDGTDYVMKSGDSVNAILYMKAPSTVKEELHRYPITYNNIYIQDTVIDSDGGTFDYFIHQDYTKVKYKITGSFSLDKISSENADDKIEGMKFKLFGTSDFGTEVDLVKETDQDGHIDFKDIEKGEYILQEYGGLIDWQEDHTEYKVVIHGDGSVSIDGEKKDNIVITNKPRVHTDVKFVKTDLTKKSKRLNDAKFKLWGTSDYGNEIIKYATSQVNGTVTFENVELGTYKLEELEAPEGYVRERNTYTVTVDQSGNYSISNYSKTSEEKEVTKHSSTPNVAEDGTQNGNYANSLAKTDVVTIPGAKSLKVKIVWGGESASYDWVCAWKGDHSGYTAANNYSSSFTGKLGGGSHTNSSNTKEYTVNGDTVTFAFKSDSSGCGDGYGYWAEISGTANIVQENGGLLEQDKKGNSLFYNEPLHDFRLVKKSSYDGNTIAGAVFELKGTSDYGTKINQTVTSETNGFVDFRGLESGTYTLQEVKSPDGFRLDDTKRIVTITKLGEITISGLAKNKYGNFDVTNQKIPEGQITVIKKWKDKKKPEERTMPTIKISGKKPEITYSGEATIGKNQWDSAKNILKLTNGKTFQKDNGIYTVKTFTKKHSNAVKVDDGTTNKSIYLYRDGDDFYWWTDAEKAYLAQDSSDMFYNCNALTQLDLSNFDTSSVTNMSSMFNYCNALTQLDLSNFDTSSVANMSSMFYNCKALNQLDLSSLDTSSVTEMDSMFSSCKALTKLDLSNFDTNNVTSMNSMFADCQVLTQLDLSSFNTSKVTSMSNMFDDCYDLTQLDLSNFNTNNVTSMSGMFYSCNKLTQLDLSNFNTSKVTSMSCMFDDCYALTQIDLSNFDTNEVTNMSYMFSNCQALTQLDLSIFNTSHATDMSFMFQYCSKLLRFDLSNFDTSSVTDMSYMFEGCSSITSLNLNNFDTHSVTNMCNMFCDCSSLTQLDLSNFDTSKVTSMSSMFRDCSSLTQLDLSDFSTSQVTDMNYMFYNCGSLHVLDVHTFNTSSVTRMDYMFYGCYQCTTINVSGFNTSKVTSMSYMFFGCTNNTTLDLLSFDTSKVTTMEQMFCRCYHLVNVDLSNFNTVNVTNMNSMFNGLAYITNLNLSNFDTSSVTSMSYMFYNCQSLTTIYVSDKWNTGKVTNSYQMFASCTKLPNFDSSKTDKTNAHYGDGGYLTYKASTTAKIKNILTALAQSFQPLQVQAAETEDNLAEGTSGTCTWYITQDGELVIKPTSGNEGTLDSIGDYDESPWYSNSSSIKSVRFEGMVYGGSNCNYMFYDCSKVTSINFTGFNSSNVTDMAGMFAGCSSLISLDFSSIDTSKVTNMYAMFNLCDSLTSLNLHSFNTKNVTNMEYMFSGCYDLTYLNISSFNTSKVTSMKQMFFGCENLTSIIVISFNTASVQDMSCMFWDCSSLSSLNLKYFNTSNVTTMQGMFNGCTSLETIYLNNFSTYNVKDMSFMFNGCKALTDLDLTNFNTAQVTDMSAMFQNCESLVSLNLSNFNTSKVKDMSFLVGSCFKLTNIDLSNFDTSNVKDMHDMFYNCNALTELNVSNFNTLHVTSMLSMFKGCESLTTLDLSSFDTCNVTEMCDSFGGMFTDCESLTTLDVSNFDTSKVTNMYEMFKNCRSLTILNVSTFNTNEVTDMSYMFYHCAKLTQLDLSNFSTYNAITISGMFSKCSNLSILKLGKDFKSLQDTGLPTPSPTGTGDGQYTGKWTKGTPFNHTDAITASDLMSTFSGATMADTWYWEQNGQDPRLEQTYTSISNRVFNPADYTPTDDMTQEQKDALAQARDTLLAQFQTEDSDGNAGYWTHIDDNTDMYTFYVYDANINWNVWEDDVNGDYNTDYDITNPYVISATATDKTATITNTIPEEEPSQDLGSLSITKQVVDWDGTDIKDNREFTFKVTLTDADGKALDQSNVFGDIAFSNGKATITLKDNETVTMSDIPAGYHYKVEEETPNGYTAAFTNQKGEITKDTTATVTAVNKKDKPKEETPKYVDLTLAKKLTGNYEEKSGSYVMHIAFSDLAKSTTYKLSDGTDFSSDDYGNVDVEITLAPDESVIIKDLPVGAKYTVTEEAGDYFSSYTIEDSNKLGKIQKSKDSNSEKNKDLSTSQETADEGENVTVTYINRIQDVQDLKLTKKVVNGKGTEVPDKEQYEVSIHFENMEPNSSFMSDLGLIQADDDGVVDLNTYIKAGDVINFRQVPVGTVYKFTELANDKTASYTVEDSNKLGKINSTKAANTEVQKDLATADEVVNKGEEATVTFYNAKASLGSLKLIKKDGNTKLKGVTFALAQEDGTVVDSKTTDSNGEVLFDELEEGTYTVRETKTVKGHSLLSEPFTVTIPFTIKKSKAEEEKLDTSKAVLMGDTYYYYDLTYTIDNGKLLDLPKTGLDKQSYLWVTLAIAATISIECWIATRKRKTHKH